MNTKVFEIHGKHFSKDALKDCAEALRDGGSAVFPTDTVYGLACNAFHPDGIKKIYSLKGRSYSKALPIFVADPAQLPLVAKDILPECEELIRSYWPGPLTLVFKTAPIALGATRGKATIAVRIPDHGIVRELLEMMHVPLAVTSANKSGQKAIVDGKKVENLFSGRVDVIMNGGACKTGRESTVVDVTHYPFTVLREGAISKAELTRKLNLG